MRMKRPAQFFRLSIGLILLILAVAAQGQEVNLVSVETVVAGEPVLTLVEAESKYEHDLFPPNPISVSFNATGLSGVIRFDLLENGVKRASSVTSDFHDIIAIGYTPKLPGVVQLTIVAVRDGDTVASSETVNVRIYGTAMDPALDNETLPYTSAIYLHAESLVRNDTVARLDFGALVDRLHTGKVTGGTFTLTLGSDSTGPIPFDASDADVEQALANLPGVGAGNVLVSFVQSPLSTPDSKFRSFTVQFTGSLARRPMPLLTGTGENLTYEFTPTVSGRSLRIYRVQGGTAGPEELDDVQVIRLVGEEVPIAGDPSAPYAVLWYPAATLNDVDFPFRADSSVEIFARAVTAKGRVYASDGSAVHVIPVVPSPQGNLTVEINATNLQQLPGNNRIVAANTPVTLTAQAKDAAGIGRIVQSVQFFLDGVAMAPVVGAFPYRVDWTPKVAGTYVLTAIAIDDKNNRIVSAPMYINVTDNRPYVRIVNPISATAAPLAVPSGTEITFTAITAGSTGDPGTTGVVFSVDGTLVATAGENGVFTARWAPANIGISPKTYQISATVTDANLTANISDTAFVTVLPRSFLGAPPSVSTTSPANGEITSSSIVNFAVFANDSDGEVVAVRFFANGVFIGEATRDQQSNSWRLPYQLGRFGTGDYSIVAEAVDNAGNSTVSSPAIRASVVNSTTASPALVLSASRTALTQGDSVLLLGSAASASPIVSVEYFANGISLGSSQPATPMTWTPTVPGNYALYAVAVDEARNIAVSPQVIVTLKAGYSVDSDEAFVTQTYRDLLGRVPTSAELVTATQISAGALTRAQLVANVVTSGSFTYAFQSALSYRAVVGDWPGYADYVEGTTALSGGTTLASRVATLLSSANYIARNGPLPDLTTVNSGQYARVSAFTTQLYQNIYGRTPSLIEVQAMLNDINTSGVSAAVANFLTAKFVSGSDAGVTARVRAAVLVAGLWRMAASDAQVGTLSGVMLANAAGTVLGSASYTGRFFTVDVFPASVSVAAGQAALLTAQVEGSPPFSYQWYRNGIPVPGAVQPALTLNHASASTTGSYHVVVANADVSVASATVPVMVGGAVSRLANISTRGRVGAGDQVMIVGFVVSAGAAKPMLVRVAGPALASTAGLSGTLAEPQLRLHAGNAVLATNARWGDAGNLGALIAASSATGAFSFAAGSADSALLSSLGEGVYTGVGSGLGGGTGLALVEVYDGDLTQGGRLMNLSTRGFVGTGAQQLIAGFVIRGGASKQVLVRAAGPTLGSVGGLSGTLHDPRLELVAESGLRLRVNDNWGDAPEASLVPGAATAVGAFAFPAGSADAALIANLAPGLYTVLVSGASASDTGIALVEVYDLDP